MSEKGINDLVLDKMMNLQERASRKIKEVTKGKAPFAMEKISNQEKLDLVNALTPQDVYQLIEEFGEDSVNRFIYEAKSWEMKQQAKLGGSSWMV